MNAAMDLQENLLNDITALLCIQGNAEGDGEQLFSKPPHQKLECPLVAALQPNDQFIIVDNPVLYGFRHRLMKKVQLLRVV